MLFEKYKATNYREAELGAAEAEGNVGGGVGQQLHIQTKLSFKWSKIITFNTNILIYCEK